MEALHTQVKETLQPPYQIAAQNSWARGVGAYTGEIAPELLTDLGIGWVILGHSERRSIIGESSELVRMSPGGATSPGRDSCCSRSKDGPDVPAVSYLASLPSCVPCGRNGSAPQP